ncbi:carbohydrate kinase, partial [Mycobacterium sp. ITM-2017-0098]
MEVVDTVGAEQIQRPQRVDQAGHERVSGADRRAQLTGIDRDALTAVVRAATLNSALTVARAGADLPDRV